MADFLIPAKAMATALKCPVVEPITQFIHVPNWSLFMTAVIASIVSLAVGAGTGWYVAKRGMAGVQNDLNNAKNEIANLKANISAEVSKVQAS